MPKQLCNRDSQMKILDMAETWIQFSGNGTIEMAKVNEETNTSPQNSLWPELIYSQKKQHSNSKRKYLKVIHT